MTKNSVDHPDDHEAKIASSTELALERVATLADIENRQPDSKEIWYGHSILTSTLFPATPQRKAPPSSARTTTPSNISSKPVSIASPDQGTTRMGNTLGC